MKHILPLCYTRVWCRKNQAWLSFKTVNQERFLVNPDGYFIELPDGSLTRISPRTTFPVVGRFPSILLSDLAARKQFAPDALFISVPMRTTERQEPVKIPVEDLRADPLAGLRFGRPISDLERFLLLRVLENGILPIGELQRVMDLREQNNQTVGEILLNNNICHWETLLGQCLDIRPPSRLDPPNLRTIIERREWELTGEILVSLNKINRTELEHALKLKREANQALGQILTAMGACRKEDIQHCLRIQEQLKYADHEGVVLIGKLLVTQGVVSESDLEDVLWKQRVARQPLGRILVSMGACSQKEIDQYEAVHGSGFQQAVDEAAMGNYLVKTETITKTQLEEALRVQQRGRQVLGEMLVAMGLCKNEDIDVIVALQSEVREAYRSGVQRLGDLLIKKGKVPQRLVDEALRTQSIGRQPFGAILTAMGACTTDDVNFALEVQRKWRSRGKDPGDRLGEVLVKSGILTEQQLEAPLLQHMREEKPLGRILVENHVCKPEDIIGALIERDNQRQEQFLAYVRAHLPSVEPATLREPVPAILQGDQPEGSFVHKLSNLFGKAKQKEKG
jgi:hypothetical protein